MEGSDGRRCVPEAAAAAPPPPRPPPSLLPPPSSPPPPSLPPPPPTTATPAAALACQLLTWRQVSPPCPPPPVRPPSAPMRAPCPPVSHQRRRWRRSRHPLRLLPRDCGQPHPALPHASAALAWQAVAVQMNLAVGSRGGGQQVANSIVAFCRSFRLHGSPCSEAACGIAACAAPACILCTLALRPLRLATTTTSSFSFIGIHLALAGTLRRRSVCVCVVQAMCMTRMASLTELCITRVRRRKFACSVIIFGKLLGFGALRFTIFFRSKVVHTRAFTYSHSTLTVHGAGWAPTAQFLSQRLLL